MAINTDIIVGFPGETDEQFDETVSVLADLKLDKAHLARYSPRPGTVSARAMTDDVPEEVKVERHRALERLQERVCAGINARMLGETVEDPGRGTLTRESGAVARVRTSWCSSKVTLPLRGRLVDVQITWTGPWSMQGRFVRDVSPLGDLRRRGRGSNGAAGRRLARPQGVDTSNVARGAPRLPCTQSNH